MLAEQRIQEDVRYRIIDDLFELFDEKECKEGMTGGQKYRVFFEKVFPDCNTKPIILNENSFRGYCRYDSLFVRLVHDCPTCYD